MYNDNYKDGYLYTIKIIDGTEIHCDTYDSYDNTIKVEDKNHKVYIIPFTSLLYIREEND